MKEKPVYLLIVVIIFWFFTLSAGWSNNGHAAEQTESLTLSHDRQLATTPVKIKTVAPNILDKEKTALLNWAVYLSGYSTNGQAPRLYFKPKDFFVDHACEGRNECRVLGWYNDQEIVYIDDRLTGTDSMFVRSLLVHEFVHYLQHISGKFALNTCTEFVQREREAYAIQQQFFIAHGTMPKIQTHYRSCVEPDDIGTALAHGD